MIYLQTFENYNYYNDDMIMEKFNLKYHLDKLKKSTNKNKLATLIVASLLSIYTANQALNFIQRSNINEPEKIILIDTINKVEDKYKDPLILNISQNGIQHLKKFEDIKLEKYYLDGVALVGYGHKILPNEKYTTITPEIAEKLLIVDATYASDGVKRLFKLWKSMGIDIKVTQNQFDVMVSLAYSMGVGAFRGSDFVQALKQKDFVKASQLLKYTGISHPGHIKRRSVECNIFKL
jgi:lysozyme